MTDQPAKPADCVCPGEHKLRADGTFWCAECQEACYPWKDGQCWAGLLGREVASGD